MKIGIAAAASLALCAQAMAEPATYAVDGVTVGRQLDRSNASYREYKCSPSEQFSGVTWCQKARAEKERGKSFSAAYSLAHGPDGNVVYVNRWQEPSFLNAPQAQQEIERYSSKVGEKPHLINMPARSGMPQGIIATWGQVTLEPLDAASVKLLAAGKSPKKGLLIDYLGNFARSAKDGLPVYRITGGAGFVWSASFDQKGRGALRTVAVDTSGLVLSAPAAEAASQQKAAEEAQPAEEPALASEPQATTVADAGSFVQATPATAADAAPEPQAAADAAPSAAAGESAETNGDRAALMQKIEKLQQRLASATGMIAELEKGKAAVQSAQIEAAKARRVAEQRVAQIGGGAASAYVKDKRWENAAYGAAGGLGMVLLASAIGFCWKRYNARSSVADASAPSAPSGSTEGSPEEGETFVASPALAMAEDAFGRELEQQVAALNEGELQPQSKDALQPEPAAAVEVQSEDGEKAPVPV